MDKRKRWLVPFAAVFALLFVFAGCRETAAGEDILAQNMDVIEEYMDVVEREDYILHALGGMEGQYSYINSIDCLEENYAAGYRLFEVDVSFTSDGKLVLAHSTDHNVWSKADWENKLGQPYDESHPLASYDEFMKFQIPGGFRPSSFMDLLDFMREHDDLFVMIDPAYRDYEETVKLYSEIVELADRDADLLSHMIVAGQSTAMMKAARSVYDFPICNLYFSPDSRREESIFSPKDFIQFCKDNEILSFSVSSSVYTEEYASQMKDSGLICYVFTINDEQEARRFFDMGADVVGTDFLR